MMVNESHVCSDNDSVDSSDSSPPRFTQPVMLHRFKSLLPDLRKAKSAVEQSESADDIAHLRDALDMLMKWQHDCQHISRGCVHSRADQRTIRWFLDTLTEILNELELLQLDESDEYIDIKSEKNLVSKYLLPVQLDEASNDGHRRNSETNCAEVQQPRIDDNQVEPMDIVPNESVSPIFKVGFLRVHDTIM